MNLEAIISGIAVAIEIAGVATIVIGIIAGSVSFGLNYYKHEENALDCFRKKVGRSILLGLELLVAADIIDTVTVDPTLDKVLVLGLVVLIRTFLSFSLEIELEGTFPWRMRNKESNAPK